MPGADQSEAGSSLLAHGDMANVLERAYLGAAIAVGLDHVLCPLLDLELNGQLLLQAGHSAQGGRRAERAALCKGLGSI